MSKPKILTIKQKIVLSFPPHEVYEMLMDSKKHAEFTGEPARISRKVGGFFSTYSGYAKGKNLELVPDKKIVQTWRADDWPKNKISTVTYSLSQVPKNRTTLNFTQKDIPADQYEDVANGWKEFYWEKMK